MRRFLLGLLTLLVVVTVLSGWLVYRGMQARSGLTAASERLPTLQEQVTSGDVDAARATLDRLQQDTGQAREAVQGPVWRLAAMLPFGGQNLDAVATVALAVDDVATDALPPLLDAATVLDPQALAPTDGQVDLDPLLEAGPQLEQANAAIAAARDQVVAIDTADLVEQVAGPVEELQQQMERVAAATSTGATALSLLPPMLGADEPRSYLVLFQNNAELRATGGIPGAFAVVTADDGRIELTGQGSTGDIGPFDEPVLPLSEELLALHGEKLGIFFQDINLTPDFPTVALLAQEMYRRESGVTVDGVIGTDPVALSYLLASTGPVQLPGGEQITADNAVPLLLSEVYTRFSDPVQQDQFFALAAEATFDALAAGQGNPAVSVQALARAADERRLMVWSAQDGEQAQLAGTVLEGRLPDGPTTSDDGSDGSDGSVLSPTVGVFLNDGTAAKLDYYLHQEVEVLDGPCRPDGYRDFRVRLTLTSQVPAEGLSDYVLGGAYLDAPPGTNRKVVLIYGPHGGGIVGVSVDSERVPLGSYSERGRPVGVVTVDLSPGERRLVEFDVLGTAEAPGMPNIETTPGVHTTEISQTDARCV